MVAWVVSGMFASMDHIVQGEQPTTGPFCEPANCWTGPTLFVAVVTFSTSRRKGPFAGEVN